MKRIIFYAAGPILTTDEQTALDKFNASAAQPYEVIVMNAKAPAQSTPLRAADYRYGATPSGYSALPVADPDAPPTAPLSDTQVVIADGAVLPIIDAGSATVAGAIAVVEDGVLKSSALPAVNAIVANTDSISALPVKVGAAADANYTAVLTVAGGKITHIALTAS
uniref:Virion structural protein n=1 Tax=Pseudomonas phage Pavpe01 TaxID=3138545 RepID=A0AAU6W0Z1_9VIRU